MSSDLPGFACPYPIRDYPHVLLAHGGGGRLMHRLIEEIFLNAFGSDAATAHDSAVIPAEGERLAFTTDSFVVKPLFFPGGDIGSLAVHGTVNDLAMSGARPRYLSAAFIIEEGLPIETLVRVVGSMQAAARQAGVRIVTGDTKVVDRGKGDGLFINTAGIGVLGPGVDIRPGRVRPGDAVIVSGDVGRHGMAIMAVREGLEFETTIQSDSAPLATLVEMLLTGGIEVRCLRDITRGGLTTCLNEIAAGSGTTVMLEEEKVPVAADVRAACEMLGIDPMQVACEGRFCAFLPEAQAARAVAILREATPETGACRIGRVVEQATAPVLLKTTLGTVRILDTPSGELLPRIC